MRKWCLLLVFIAVLLIGCSDNMQTKETENTKEKTTIHIMHYWGENNADESAKCFREIIDNEFEEVFPNVELVEDVYDTETYKRRIKIMMASNEMPDIMLGHGGGFSEAFVNSGKVLALDPYLDEDYKDKMTMQENFIYDGKQYGICYTYWMGVLYCNQSLFSQAGAEIPQTYEELLLASKKLREHNIQPVACGMLDQWHGQQWINNFTLQLGGAELYNRLAKEEETLDNETLATAADLVQNLVRKEVFCDDMSNLISSEAEEMFLNGETAMIYIGNWYTTTAEERLGDNLRVVKMPVVPGAQYLDDYHGGGTHGLMVSADTEYPELATEIVEWLAYRLSCYQPQSSTFQLAEGDQKRSIDAVEEEILQMYADKQESGCAWDTIMTLESSDSWLDLCGKLYDLRVNGTGFTKLLKSRIEWRNIN